MGYREHHAIIMTGWETKRLRALWRFAKTLFPRVSNITAVGHNSYRSFLIPPDGSNVGRDHSRVMDEARDQFIAELGRYSGIDWVEVVFARELYGGDAMVLRRSEA